MLETYFVVFLLAEEAYAIPVAHVQEIQGYTTHNSPRKVPGTPDYFEGIIDLRGEVIPVLDLKQHFQLGKTVPSRKTRYIIVSTPQEKVGILVDAVLEVQKVLQEHFTPPPERLLASVGKSYISGITRLNTKAEDTTQVIHLNIHKLLEETKVFKE